MTSSWEEILFAAEKPAVAALPPTNVIPITGDDENSRRRRYAAKALADEVAQVAAAPTGCRNDTLNRAAFSLRRFVTDGILTEDEVHSALAGAAHSAGLAHAEIAATIGSATRGSDAKPRDRPAVPPPDPRRSGVTEVTPESLAAATTGPGEPEEEGWPFVDGASFVLDIPPTIPALWGDGDQILWAEGESLMIAGPMGLGKTTLAGQLIRTQLGIGDPEMLGLAVAPRRRVLYLAMDRPAQIARAMARQFGPEHRDILADKLVIWKGPPPADIAKNPALLSYLAERADADTVYVDSLKDAAIGLSEDEVGAGYNRARQQLLAGGVQLAELHHTVKRGAGGGAPTHVADVYGSAWLTNGTGSIILLSGEPGDPIVGFKHPRQPAEEVGPLQLLHDQAAGTITVNHQTSLTDMVAHCGPEGLTAKGAAMALFDTDRPSRGQIEKARRRLDRLEQEGLIVCCEGPKGGPGSPVAVWFPAARRSS